MPNPEQSGMPFLQRQDDCDLRQLNTFGLPARARVLYRLTQTAQLPSLLEQLAREALPPLILGNGSNIVFAGDVTRPVIKVELYGKRLLCEDDQAWYVQVGAGEDWHSFVRWTLDNGWPGLENLSLIPGTVGAAPVQNIGAYGLEMVQRFHRLEAWSLCDGQPRVYGAEDCCFGYRDSVFKRADSAHLLIASVTFRLPKQWQPLLDYADIAQKIPAQNRRQIQAIDISNAVIAIRQHKLPDPARLGNAGSFFKNPVIEAAALGFLLKAHPTLPHYGQADGSFKLAAGWLIEQCGWKGRRLGAVGCYERQALILVNHGGANGEAVRALSEAIQHDVKARFGIALEPEPVFV